MSLRTLRTISGLLHYYTDWKALVLNGGKPGLSCASFIGPLHPFVIGSQTATVTIDSNSNEEYLSLPPRISLDSLHIFASTLPKLTEIRTRPFGAECYYFPEPNEDDASTSGAAEEGSSPEIDVNMACVITFHRDRYGNFERLKIVNIEWDKSADSMLTGSWRKNAGGEL
jgi:hypothetical protein